jgi:hypothetical protein
LQRFVCFGCARVLVQCMEVDFPTIDTALHWRLKRRVWRMIRHEAYTSMCSLFSKTYTVLQNRCQHLGCSHVTCKHASSRPCSRLGTYAKTLCPFRDTTTLRLREAGQVDNCDKVAQKSPFPRCGVPCDMPQKRACVVNVMQAIVIRHRVHTGWPQLPPCPFKRAPRHATACA